jgi:3-hydroxybutyryl-CoA dehydratase
MSIAAGTVLPPFRVECVSPESMKAWAGFLRDPNPIHLDPQTVKSKGLGDRVINQGPANLAYVINMLQSAFPAATIRTIDIRYVDNVFGGEAVEASGRVTEVTASAGEVNVTCEVWLRAEARGAVISGTATLSVPVGG